MVECSGYRLWNSMVRCNSVTLRSVWLLVTAGVIEAGFDKWKDAMSDLCSANEFKGCLWNPNEIDLYKLVVMFVFAIMLSGERQKGRPEDKQEEECSVP